MKPETEQNYRHPEMLMVHTETVLRIVHFKQVLATSITDPELWKQAVEELDELLMEVHSDGFDEAASK